VKHNIYILLHACSATVLLLHSWAEGLTRIYGIQHLYRIKKRQYCRCIHIYNSIVAHALVSAFSFVYVYTHIRSHIHIRYTTSPSYVYHLYCIYTHIYNSDVAHALVTAFSFAYVYTHTRSHIYTYIQDIHHFHRIYTVCIVYGYTYTIATSRTL